MNRIVFCTHVDDHLYESYGASKLVASWRHFHPEVPTYVFGSDEIRLVREMYPTIDLNYIHPFLASQLMEQGYDWVVHYDADSMLTGPQVELLRMIESGDYDVIGVRNNNDFNRAGKDLAITQYDTTVETYWNAGLVAVGNLSFYEDWKRFNRFDNYSSPFQEQSVLNSLVRNTKYRTVLVDAVGTKVFYGLANAWGMTTHWDSWGVFFVDTVGELAVDVGVHRKKVRVIHQGGGHGQQKLSLTEFTPEVRAYLNRIITNGQT